MERTSSYFMKYVFPFAGLYLLMLTGCTKDKSKTADVSGYPDNIAQIMVTKCATNGCHNTISKSGAAGLDLSTWDKAMEGGSMGAAIIPYAHKQSTVFLFTNTDSLLGSVAKPTMPYNLTALSHDEVVTLRDWIDNGAPNKDGFVKFSDNPQRNKVYITNQGCDIVGVVDAESKLVMRYIPVGNTAGIEGPHMVRVSADGTFWCVCFIGGTVIQKYSTTDDKLLGQVEIGAGQWNTFILSHDGTKAFCVDWSGLGHVVCADLVNYTVTPLLGDLVYPHGSALSADEKFLYVTGNQGNFIYKIDIHDFNNIDYSQIAVDGSGIPIETSSIDIHDIIFSPDKSKYFLSCQKSNEVRVMNAANDSLLAVLPVGNYPQEFAISTSTPHLFVTCMEDNVTYAPNTGSVFIIDYNNLSVVKSLYTGWQPHGVAIDENRKLVYVANRNNNPTGPAPHHVTDCGGRDGSLTLINLSTLQMVSGFNTELSVDPYSAAYR